MQQLIKNSKRLPVPRLNTSDLEPMCSQNLTTNKSTIGQVNIFYINKFMKHCVYIFFEILLNCRVLVPN